MLERLRHRLGLLPPDTDQPAIEARRGQVVCEYLGAYRALCRQVGPVVYAEDLGLDPSLVGLRTIAYAAAWRDMEPGCDFIDEAIVAAEAGFKDWLAAPADL